MLYIQKLKSHHDMCEKRYEVAQAERQKEERKRTLVLQRQQDTAPDREALGLVSEESSFEFSEDDYVPECGVTNSDSSLDVKLERKRKVQKTHSDREVSVLLKKTHLLPAKESGPSSTDDSVTVMTCQDSDDAAHVKRQKKTSKRKAQKRSPDHAEEVTVPCKKRRPQTSKESGSSSYKSVMVMTLKKKPDGGRLYNKTSYCTFCSKPYRKMARHLESKHKDKPDVARAIAFPKGSKERRIQFSLLKNKGNRIHNSDVLKKGKGIVIPRQQPNNPVKPSDYMHCINCEAYLKRRSLWKHMKICHLKRTAEGYKRGKSRVQTLCAYTQPVPNSVSEQLWKLVLSMNEDDVAHAVRNERLILKLGEHLFNKHGHDITKHEYIRQKMRETGRLLLQGQQSQNLKEMSDFFAPANFPRVIEAVKVVAGFSEETGTYTTPSLALKLGHSLKKLANILECEGMMSGDEEAIHNAKVFRQICNTKWNECISSQALRTLTEAKWNRPQLLPFTEDVKKMHQCIDKQRKDFQQKLELEKSKKNWSELAKLTLCELIIFNRRREGEVSKMSVSSFTARQTWSHPDVELALTDLEKKLCEHFQRIEIRGKRGRKVPLLLTPEMQASMELLAKTRNDCEVPDSNQFMFARPQALTHFRGSDVIRQIAQSCGASNPEALSSTKLRKHMATMSQLLNLKDNEMDNLADFLGHDIRVHRQYYRLPEGTLQLAKVSKMLMALERGRMAEFKGQTLDEISIDPQEEIAQDSDQSDLDEDDDQMAASTSFSTPSRPSSSTPSSSSRLSTSSTTSSSSRLSTSSTTSSSSRLSTSSTPSSSSSPSSNKSSERERSTSGKDSTLPAQDKSSERERSTSGKDSTLPAQGSSQRRRKWSEEEVQAVEKTLNSFIRSRRVPGKADCMRCIEESPQALQDRSWTAVKFYVKNRIDAAKRGR
ncbi:uncharacterized protein LOC144464173 [Epinephelus lanceolatus]